MHVIYQNSTSQEHNFDSFSKNMIQICNKHRKEGRALAFAFILYDFENPQVNKILNDAEYWQSLNQISGRYLTIFSLNFKETRTPNRYLYSTFKGNQMLTSISTSNNLQEGSNNLIKKYFGEDTAVNYPAILFFQVDKDAVIDSLLIELREKFKEPSYYEIEEYIRSSVEALKDIEPRNRSNLKEIFDCLERSVQYTNSQRKIKRVVKNSGSILGLIASIIGAFK